MSSSFYHSYLLRLWLEPNDPTEWRAILENPLNGERHGFANLAALFVYLEQETQRREKESTQNRPDVRNFIP